MNKDRLKELAGITENVDVIPTYKNNLIPWVVWVTV